MLVFFGLNFVMILSAHVATRCIFTIQTEQVGIVGKGTLIQFFFIFWPRRVRYSLPSSPKAFTPTYPISCFMQVLFTCINIYVIETRKAWNGWFWKKENNWFWRKNTVKIIPSFLLDTFAKMYKKKLEKDLGSNFRGTCPLKCKDFFDAFH